MKKYRITKKESELKSIISQSIRLKTNILWQTNGEFRQVFSIVEMKKDVQLNLLLLKIDLSFGTIDPNQPIYIKLDFNDSVFKAKCLRFEHDVITIISPVQIHTIEKRNAPRKRFRSYEDANVDLAMSIYEDFSSPHNLRLKLLDISLEGFAIQVSKTNLDFIRKCQVFNLLELNNKNLTSPVPVNFSYASAVIKNTGGKQKIINLIGFSFKKPFTKEQLKLYF